jgi:hypothetical protein
MFARLFKRRAQTPNHDMPVYGKIGMINLISYTHKDRPDGRRIRQFAIDDVPSFATDIRLDTDD